MDVVTFGGFTLDYLELGDGSTFLGILGGNAVYSALGAHLWGVSTAVLGKVGQDYPQAWLAVLEDAGLDMHMVERIRQPHFQLFPARYDSAGHRELTIPPQVSRACDGQTLEHLNQFLSADDPLKFVQPFMLTPDEIPAECFGAAGFHCAPVPLATQQELVHMFKQAGCIVSADPNIQDMLKVKKAAELAPLLQAIDLFLPSREEVSHLNPDLTALAREFSEMGPRVVAIKLGSEGSLVYERARGTSFQVPAVATDAIDPTGAGDAYCGGFLAGYLQSGDARRAAECGTVSASFVIQAPGLVHALAVSGDEVKRRHLAQFERSLS